jgi:hypothetical protein
MLEESRVEIGLEYYSVSPTTLDEVFLRVVGEEEEEDTGKKHSKGFRLGRGKGGWWCPCLPA